MLEDGEISDDSDDDINPYIPLARPGIAMPSVIKSVVDEEDLPVIAPIKKVSFGSSDSDSDEEIGGKRLKIIPKRSNKYNIWSKDPDDFLTDVLDKIGMDETPENDRNVENYLGRKWKRQGPRKRKIPKAPKGDVLHPAAQAKILDPLWVTVENTVDEIAGDIAVKLDEPNIPLIKKIVETIGKEKSINLFEATKDIESEGGMLVLTGNRKRTSGGIFIFLVRDDEHITGIQRDEIFGNKDILSCIKRKRRKGRPKHLKDQLSNPPPSPEADLPPLPLRREIVLYDNTMF